MPNFNFVAPVNAELWPLPDRQRHSINYMILSFFIAHKFTHEITKKSKKQMPLLYKYRLVTFLFYVFQKKSSVICLQNRTNKYNHVYALPHTLQSTLYHSNCLLCSVWGLWHVHFLRWYSIWWTLALELGRSLPGKNRNWD